VDSKNDDMADDVGARTGPAKEGESMKWSSVLIVLGALGVTEAPARADLFDGMLNRLGKTVENRTQRLGDKAINETFDDADQGVDCTVGDKRCTDRARDEGPTVRTVPASSGVARCTPSDKACLQAASALGQKVEIVSEVESDTITCHLNDASCLLRAQQLRKKVNVVQ
jgi:hypothetical protein